MRTSEVRQPIEQYENAFRALVDEAVAHGPARPQELDENTEYEGPDLGGVVSAYLEASNALADVLLGSGDDDMYSAAAAIRRTLALASGDFLAAQVLAGLAAGQNLIAGVLEEEFARPLRRAEPIELLGQTMLTEGLPTVSAGLRGLEQLGASGGPVSRDELVDLADVVVEDVFARGADVVSSAVHAAIPTSQLIGWGRAIFHAFPDALTSFPQVRGWLAKTVRRLLEAAREKIMGVLLRVLSHLPGAAGDYLTAQAKQLADWLKDLPADRLIESGLRRFYDLDALRSVCERKIGNLDEWQRQEAFERLRAIPRHATSWLLVGRYGASALSMAAPLLHGTGYGFPLAVAAGALIIFYALWVVHDHLDWPPWWQSILKAEGVVAVL